MVVMLLLISTIVPVVTFLIIRINVAVTLSLCTSTMVATV